MPKKDILRGFWFDSRDIQNAVCVCDRLFKRISCVPLVVLVICGSVE